MTAEPNPSAEKASFYLALQVSLIAWSIVSLVVGGALVVPSIPLYVLSLTGMLVILWMGMHDPVYRRIRGSSRPAGA